MLYLYSLTPHLSLVYTPNPLFYTTPHDISHTHYNMGIKYARHFWSAHQSHNKLPYCHTLYTVLKSVPPPSLITSLQGYTFSPSSSKLVYTAVYNILLVQLWRHPHLSIYIGNLICPLLPQKLIRTFTLLHFLGRTLYLGLLWGYSAMGYLSPVFCIILFFDIPGIPSTNPSVLSSHTGIPCLRWTHYHNSLNSLCVFFSNQKWTFYLGDNYPMIITLFYFLKSWCYYRMRDNTPQVSSGILFRRKRWLREGCAQSTFLRSSRMRLKCNRVS